MWKVRIPLWVVCSQSAVFLLSFKGDSTDVLAPLTPKDPTVLLNTGWPLGDNQRDGWQCRCSRLLTTASLAKPAFPEARVKSEANVGRIHRMRIERDNWTDFGDTGAHSAASLTYPFNVHHLECDAISPLTSTAVFVRKAYGVRKHCSDQHFPAALHV